MRRARKEETPAGEEMFRARDVREIERELTRETDEGRRNALIEELRRNLQAEQINALMVNVLRQR